jgi:hypothetical protein
MRPALKFLPARTLAITVGIALLGLGPAPRALAQLSPASIRRQQEIQRFQRQVAEQRQQLAQQRQQVAQQGQLLQPREVVLPRGDDETIHPPVPNSGRPFDELVAALDDPALTVRQTAHAEISLRSDVTMPQIEGALARNDLSPEQRIRLDDAARERFISGPRAAMGISWNLDIPNRASIVKPIEGFDAFNKLEPGDIFVSVDNLPIRGPNPQQQLRWQIISHDPGDVMPVTVRRGKELKSFDLVLGPYEQLGEGRGPASTADYNTAYRLREQRRGRVPTGETLGLAPDDWIVARVEGDKRFTADILRRRVAGGPVLVAGGTPRQGPDDDREDYRRAAAHAKFGPVRLSPAVRVALADPLARSRAQRHSSIHDEIRVLESKVDALRQEVKTPIDESRRPGIGLEPGRPPAAATARITTEQRLAATERALEALKAEAVESGEDADKDEK